MFNWRRLLAADGRPRNTNGNETSAIVSRARELMDNACYGEAYPLFVRLASSRMVSASLLNDLGLCAYQLGKTEEAVAWWRRALRRAPRDGTLYFNLGLGYRRQGQQSQALDCFRKARRLGLAGANLYNALGVCLAEMGRQGEALSWLGEAAAMEPADPEIQANLATMLCTLRRYREALPHYLRAARHMRHDPEIWLGIASCLEHGERRRAAVASYYRAYTLGGSGAAVWRGMVRCRLAAGDVEEAEKLLSLAAASGIDQHLLWELKGMICDWQGCHGEAVDWYNQALGLA